MTFVTTLRFTSGDRRVLDDVVNDIKQTAKRKGAELKGPHSKSPNAVRVPLSNCPGRDGGLIDSWRYTIYTRTIHIVGHSEFARATAGRDFPDDIHVEVDVERRTGAGRT